MNPCRKKKILLEVEIPLIAKAIDALFSLGLRETIKFVVDEKKQKINNDLIDKGYRYECPVCKSHYKYKPERVRAVCVCGCSSFIDLNEEPVVGVEVFSHNGVIVLSEKNFEHCRCQKGRICTGKAQTECRPSLDWVPFSYGKVCICNKSGLTLVLLDV